MNCTVIEYVRVRLDDTPVTHPSTCGSNARTKQNRSPDGGAHRVLNFWTGWNLVMGVSGQVGKETAWHPSGWSGGFADRSTCGCA